VLVGRKGWLYHDTFAMARASGYADELVFTGYVPDEDLVALYNAADLFVYPSIFEGFGLPALEAMACGTPVITSNTSALPETVGDAALMVDPLDVEALAGIIAAVLRDADLRERLRAQGLERAAGFSWEATARIILNVYRQALQKRHEHQSASHKPRLHVVQACDKTT
jgi:glycosyltransferase involved in cell wall biosynthesis